MKKNENKMWIEEHPIWSVLIGIVGLFIVFCSIMASDVEPKNNSNIDNTQSQTYKPVIEESLIEDVEESNKITMGEKNALDTALSYLRYMSFSHSGLMDQLEYEGYSYQESKYGVDNCGADWNEQATLKAQSYLDYSAFSRSGLIDQLMFEGFTRSQAEYGIQAVGY